MSAYASHNRQHGFSLLELMITLGIVAILATVAIPSFDTMMKNTRRRQSVDNFWHAIFLARNEAIKRNSVVVLCKSRDGTQCDNRPGNWAHGWLVFENVDHDEPAQIDADEPILRMYNAVEQISVISNPTSEAGRQTFTFRPVAQGGVTGTVVFCDARGSSEARAIIISQTGRPRQSTRDASNRPLDCSNS
jgi:type IV fimbrial biogenesis protein FimT